VAIERLSDPLLIHICHSPSWLLRPGIAPPPP
jgi:hypothetical protein